MYTEMLLKWLGTSLWQAQNYMYYWYPAQVVPVSHKQNQDNIFFQCIHVHEQQT